MDEYQLFYKRRLLLTDTWRRWDIFVSAFNSSARVRAVFNKVKAKQKTWLILPEYGYSTHELPADGAIHAGGGENEAELISTFFAALGTDLTRKSIAIDLTGFVAHYVPVILAILQKLGVAKFDVLYSEPARYRQSERTRFSDEAVLDVRQLIGFEGTHNTDTNDDLLIIAVGYDYRLVAEVANYKEHSKKLQLFGLPSLRPDMYQESLLRSSHVTEAVGPDASEPKHFQYSPAYDPFVTASTVSHIVKRHREKHPRSNVYLAPLSTKAQALGFGFYFLRECVATATRIIYPFCGKYERETSEGIAGVWEYRIELPPSELEISS